MPISPPRGRPVRNPLSLAAVDSAIARSAAGFGVAFFLQSIPPLLDQVPNMRPAWVVVMVRSLGTGCVAKSSPVTYSRVGIRRGPFVGPSSALRGPRRDFETVPMLA